MFIVEDSDTVFDLAKKITFSTQEDNPEKDMFDKQDMADLVDILTIMLANHREDWL